MSCNLIAITPERFSDELVEMAIADCASEGKKLFVLLISDQESIKNTTSLFKQSSPVGNTKAIEQSLKSHHAFLLQEDLLNIRQKARDSGIEYEEVTLTGDFEQEVINGIGHRKPGTLFVCKMNTRSSVSRFIRGSIVERLKKNASCKVVIV